VGEAERESQVRCKCCGRLDGKKGPKKEQGVVIVYHSNKGKGKWRVGKKMHPVMQGSKERSSR